MGTRSDIPQHNSCRYHVHVLVPWELRTCPCPCSNRSIENMQPPARHQPHRILRSNSRSVCKSHNPDIEFRPDKRHRALPIVPPHVRADTSKTRWQHGSGSRLCLGKNRGLRRADSPRFTRSRISSSIPSTRSYPRCWSRAFGSDSESSCKIRVFFLTVPLTAQCEPDPRAWG